MKITTLVGDISKFAIESSITKAYPNIGQRAIGFFVIYIKGVCFGVRAEDATLMACSFDEVRDRLRRRGTHHISFETEADASRIVEAYLTARTSGMPQRDEFFGVPVIQLAKSIASSHVDWAPDGDEAFDDSSHILQFDVGDKVRLVACRNVGSWAEISTTVVDYWMSADVFYGTLDEWQRKFEEDWRARLKSSH
jgi:hypothetical protein